MAPTEKSVTILKVLEPNHFLVKELLDEKESINAQLFAEFEEQFLNRYDQYDVIPQTAVFPVKGANILVKPENEANWYRGRVEAVLETSKGMRARVYLLDYGKIKLARKEWIRNMPHDFMRVPFQAIDFILPNIRPQSLDYDRSLNLSRQCSDSWDRSAVETVKSLAIVDKTATVIVERLDPEGTYFGQLIVYHNGSPINVNAHLIQNGFVCDSLHEEDKEKLIYATEDGFWAWLENPDPCSLVGNVFIRPVSSLSSRLSKRSNCISELSLSELTQKGAGRRSETPASILGSPRGHSSPKKVGVGRGQILLNLSREIKFQNRNHRTLGVSRHSVSSSEDKLSVTDTSSSTISISCCSMDSDKTDIVCISANPLLNIVQDLTQSTLQCSQSLPHKRGTSIKPQQPSQNVKRDVAQTSLQSSPPEPCKRENSVRPKQPLENIERHSAQTSLQHSLPLPCERDKSVRPKQIFRRDVPEASRQTSRAHETDSNIKPKRPFRNVEQDSLQNSLRYKKDYDGKKTSPHLPHQTTVPRSQVPAGCQTSVLSAGRQPHSGNSPSVSARSPACIRTTPGKFEKHSSNVALRNESSSQAQTLKNVLPSSFGRNGFINVAANIKKDLRGNSFQHTSGGASPSIGRNDLRLLQTVNMNKISQMLYGNHFSTILRIGSMIPKPVGTLEASLLTDVLIKRMEDLRFPSPSTVQANAWPAILRGRSVALIAPEQSGKTLACLLPLLSFLLQPEDYRELNTCSGPLAVVLCAKWRTCEALFLQCMQFLPECYHQKIACLYGGSGNKNEQLRVIGGCDLLITTVGYFLKLQQNVRMERLCHVMLDEADILIECFTSEVREIMVSFVSQFKRKSSKASLPYQVLLCTSHCTSGVQSFIQKMMPDPIVFVRSFGEAAVYAQVLVFPKFTAKNRLAMTLVELLQSKKKMKTVVCATSAEEVQEVCHFLNCHSIYSLAAYEGLEHFNLEKVKNEWQDTSCTAVLVVSDVVLPELNITDADWLIHYTIPEISRLIFGERFVCLATNMQRKVEANDDRQDYSKDSVCHVLLTEECKVQAPNLIRFFTRLKSASVPNQLLELGLKKQLDKDLCQNLQSFGYCKFSNWCPSRHFIKNSLDTASPNLPHCGLVKVQVRHIIDANHFYGRLQEYKNPSTGAKMSNRNCYMTLQMELFKHFGNKANLKDHGSAKEGDLCAFFKSGDAYHRVKVMNIEVSKEMFSSKKANVFFVDEGKCEIVAVDQLLKLPPEMLQIPPLAVLICACGVEPVDGDQVWTHQANSFVHKNICDKEIDAKVALCIKDTLYLEQVAVRTRVLSSAPLIMFDLCKELIKQGFALSNKSHVSALKKSCEGEIAWKEEAKSVTDAADSGRSSCSKSSTPADINDSGRSSSLRQSNSVVPPVTSNVNEASSETVRHHSVDPLNSCDSGRSSRSQRSHPAEAADSGRSSRRKHYNSGVPAATTTNNTKTVPCSNLERPKSSVSSIVSRSSNSRRSEHSLSNQQPRRGTTGVSNASSTLLCKYEAFTKTETHEVFISTCTSPHQLFVQPTRTYNDLLNLNSHINQLISRNKLVLDSNLLPGSLCISFFPNDDDERNWFRARVLDKVSENMFEVFFVDFGDSAEVNSSDLFEITPQLLKLPFQAVECSLANVEPVNGVWTDNVNDAIMSLTRDEGELFREMELKVLGSIPSKLNQDQECYVVMIWGADSQSLASRLVEMKLAVQPSTSRASASDADWEHSGTTTPEPEETTNFRSALTRLMFGDMTRSVAETSDNESVQLERLQKPRQRPTCTIREVVCDTQGPSPLPACSEMPRLEVVPNATQSLLPLVEWYQTKTEVVLSVLVDSYQEYEFYASPSSVQLHILRGDQYYKLEETLFENICPTLCQSLPLGRNIKIKILKKQKQKWPRLLKRTGKVSNIRHDPEHLETTSGDETASGRSSRASQRGRARAEMTTLHFDPCNMDDRQSDETESDSDWSQENAHKMFA